MKILCPNHFALPPHARLYFHSDSWRKLLGWREIMRYFLLLEHEKIFSLCFESHFRFFFHLHARFYDMKVSLNYVLSCPSLMWKGSTVWRFSDVKKLWKASHSRLLVVNWMMQLPRTNLKAHPGDAIPASTPSKPSERWRSWHFTFRKRNNYVHRMLPPRTSILISRKKNERKISEICKHERHSLHGSVLKLMVQKKEEGRRAFRLRSDVWHKFFVQQK